jgi:signal transduction histidine kinase
VPFLLLIVAVLVALTLPLGYTQLLADYHRFQIGQLTDCEHLAWVASGVGAKGADFDYPPDPKRLAAMIDRITDQGETVLIVDRRSRVTQTSGPHWSPDLAARLDAHLTQALRGFASSDDTDRVSKLLRAEPFIAAHPVRDSHSVVGAVVIIAPTNGLRARAGLWLLPAAGICLLALLAAVGIVSPLSRWVLRPISSLIISTRALASGDYNRRVLADTGPVEVRELSAAFNTMADRVHTALAAQRTFVSDASHQLRNPLAAVRFRVEGLTPFLPDEHHYKLDLAIAEMEHLSRTLDQLLDLARAEGRALPREPQNAGAIVTRRVLAWSEVAERRSITLTAPEAPAHVLAQSEVLDQILDILMDNALRIAPPGSTVRVLVRAQDDRTYVEVADEGPGMSDVDKARATDRFWRARTSDYRGSGLGLAIAATLLTASGGRLSFHDRRPHGLIVRVDLATATTVHSDGSAGLSRTS